MISLCTLCTVIQPTGANQFLQLPVSFFQILCSSKCMISGHRGPVQHPVKVILFNGHSPTANGKVLKGRHACDFRWGSDLCQSVESAESLGDEVEESSAGVSPVLPLWRSMRSAEDCGVELISDGPQLARKSPHLQLLQSLSPGDSLVRRRPGWGLNLVQQVGQRSLLSRGLLQLLCLGVRLLS